MSRITHGARFQALWLALGLLAAGAVGAQAPGAPQIPGFESKPIQVSPMTGDPTKEIVIVAVQIAPGSFSPVHVHPGDCTGTVVQGTVDLVVSGKAPQRVAAGEAYANLRGVVHQFRNSGDTPVRLLNFLVVDKGQPRSMPPPQ